MSKEYKNKRLDAPMLVYDIGKKMEVRPSKIEVPVSEVSIRRLVIRWLRRGLGRGEDVGEEVNVHRSGWAMVIRSQLQGRRTTRHNASSLNDWYSYLYPKYMIEENIRKMGSSGYAS